MFRILNLSSLLLTALLLTACSSPEVKTEQPPRFLPQVIDDRDGPHREAKFVDGLDVCYHLGEDYLGAPLMEILRTQVDLRAPRAAEPRLVEVTDIEITLTVEDGAQFVDELHVGTAEQPYRPAPGQLLVREVDPAQIHPLSVRIAYRLDGQLLEETTQSSARTADLQMEAREAYLAAVQQLVDRLREGRRAG